MSTPITKEKYFPLIILTFILAAWVAFFGYVESRPGAKPEPGERPNQKEEMGQLGDAFGVMNSLLSLLAVFCALYTIIQQREAIEIERQRDRNKLRVSKIEEVASLLMEVEKQITNDFNSLEESNINTLSWNEIDSLKIRTSVQQINILGQIHFPDLKLDFKALIGSISAYELSRHLGVENLAESTFEQRLDYHAEIYDRYKWALDKIYGLQTTLFNLARNLM